MSSNPGRSRGVRQPRAAGLDAGALSRDGGPELPAIAGRRGTSGEAASNPILPPFSYLKLLANLPFGFNPEGGEYLKIMESKVINKVDLSSCSGFLAGNERIPSVAQSRELGLLKIFS